MDTGGRVTQEAVTEGVHLNVDWEGVFGTHRRTPLWYYAAQIFPISPFQRAGYPQPCESTTPRLP